MDTFDHMYTNKTYDTANHVVLTYKFNAKDTEELVKLRVTNNSLFYGKNSSKRGWSAILKHMGLHRDITFRQAAKKWENLKKKYKELKWPPDGIEVFPHRWHFFTLMDDAMEGRLVGSTTILTFPQGNSDADFRPLIKSRKRAIDRIPPVVLAEPKVSKMEEIEVSLLDDDDDDEEEEKGDDAKGYQRDIGQEMEEVEKERAQMESEQATLESERVVLGRERQALKREQIALQRELATLDRDRAFLEREWAAIERERAVMERERAQMDKDRNAVNRDRLALAREKERVYERTLGNSTEEQEIKLTNSDAHERKERFLDLFEKLIENL